jgi:hypothetical protein
MGIFSKSIEVDSKVKKPTVIYEKQTVNKRLL